MGVQWGRFGSQKGDSGLYSSPFPGEGGTTIKRFYGLSSVVWALLAVFTLGGGLALADSLKGKVKKHVYYSPAKNFTVPIPSGIGMRLNDGFEAGAGGVSMGGVSFHDDFGKLMVIQYTMMPDQVMAKLQAPDTREEALKGWLHEGAMPAWYLRASPQSRVIHEEMGTFEGMPVLLAMAFIPQGSTVSVTENGIEKRLDSRRGLVIFQRGKFVYVLSTETMNTFAAAMGNAETEPGEGWQKFADGLKPFFRSIVFTD